MLHTFLEYHLIIRFTLVFYCNPTSTRWYIWHYYMNERNINHIICIEEVCKVLNKMRNNKALGIDNLPYEVLKNTESSLLLTKLFHKVFQTHIIPSLWRKSIIKPILKGSITDPHIPLQYRSIALLSTVYKIYTCTLNNRIVSYIDFKISKKDCAHRNIKTSL